MEGEIDRLERVLRLWREFPDACSEMPGILESLKDPSHAIELLRDGHVLSPAELFILANLCACAKRIRRLQAQTGIARWPADTVVPSLESVETLLAPGSQGQPRFYVSDAYSPALAETRKLRKHKQEMWHSEMAKQAKAVEAVLGVSIPRQAKSPYARQTTPRFKKPGPCVNLGKPGRRLPTCISSSNQPGLPQTSKHSSPCSRPGSVSRKLKCSGDCLKNSSLISHLSKPHLKPWVNLISCCPRQRQRAIHATRPEISYPAAASGLSTRERRDAVPKGTWASRGARRFDTPRCLSPHSSG